CGARVAAIDRGGLRRYQDLCAELLRLHERAAGERLARDSGGKAEIIFDPCARACLSAECAAVDDDDVQALGCSIDRSSKTRGSGAYDDDVEELRPLVRVEKSETARECSFGGIDENGAAWTKRQQIAGLCAVLLEQRLRTSAVDRIDDLVRL